LAIVRRFAALVAIVVGALLIAAAPASAHATLTAADPPDGARLDESPATITLTFSEGVSASLGGVRVLDTNGDRVDDGAAQADGHVVTVPLQDGLPDGTYVIAYRIISEDGHPVRGGSVFGVGDGDVDATALGRVADPNADRIWDYVGGGARGLAYAGVLLAAGGAFFLAFAHDGAGERQALVRWVRIAATVGAIGALLALPVQAALGTGDGPTSLFESGVLSEVAGEGVGLGVALAVVGAAGLALLVDRRPRWAAGAALIATASFAASGHTRSGNAAVATLADVVHLVVVAAWAGGLVLLWRTIRLRRAQADHDPLALATVALRFSTLATVAILAVGASGLVLSWNEVRSVGNLRGTNYGSVLLAKVAVVAVIAAIGAYNRFRLMPALHQGKATAGLRQLGRTVRIEAGLVAVVVALTSVLVVVTPSRTAVAGGPVERIIELGDLGEVQLVVAPARTGFNEIHLYMFDPDGRPADLAETMSVELSLPAADLGPIVRDATRAGPAHLQANGDDLVVAGEWTVTLRLRVDTFTEVSGETTVPIGR
jgi:copper transport protein